MTVEINYFYRDAANYKQHGSVLVETELTPDEVKEKLVPFLNDGEFFIAEQVGWEELFFNRTDDDDHCWHTIGDCEVSDEEAEIDFSDVLEAFEIAYLNGWQEWTGANREPIAAKPTTPLPALKNLSSLMRRHRRPLRHKWGKVYASLRPDRIVIAITIDHANPLKRTEAFHEQYRDWPQPTWNGLPVDFQFFREGDPQIANYNHHEVKA